jgi:hypothetical protein
MNLPMTHYSRQQLRVALGDCTYSLCLEMCAPQAVVVLVEIHHLKAIKLVRDLLNLFLLPWLSNFNTFGIPNNLLGSRLDFSR